MRKAKAANEGPRTLTLAEAVDAYRTVRRIETAIAPHGLSMFLLTLLAFFAEFPQARLGDGARFLGVTNSVITIGVNRLEQRGLVTRITKFDAARTTDRRRVACRVTARGHELLAALAAIEIESTKGRG